MISPRSDSVKRPLVSLARRFAPVLVLLGLIYPLACPSPLRSQSLTSPAPCAPSTPTTDENSQPTGEKVLQKIIVDNVAFDGSLSLPVSIRDQVIADLMQKRYAVDTQVLEEWNEVSVRGAWMDEGFFKMDSTLKTQIIFGDTTEQHVSVLVHVDEGIQYRLTSIRFRKYVDWDDVVRFDSDDAVDTGKPALRRKTPDDAEHLGSAELAFPPEELRTLVPLNDGDLLSTKQIKEGLDALKRLYGSHGYINFVATPLTEADDSNGTISLTMELDEGKQFRLRKTEVSGLDPQAASALKWPMRPGDIFNNELFKDFFTDNKGILPAGTSPRNLELRKNEKNGTVDLRLVFPACTGLEAATR